MKYDTTYALQLAGAWDDALAGTEDPVRRAEILVDRHLWRLDPPEPALAAIAAVGGLRARLLMSQVVYWHRLFGTASVEAYAGVDPLAEARAAIEEPAVAGWAMFWHAIMTENLAGDPTAAAEGYARAGDRARAEGDRLLASYVVRHQGFHLLSVDRDEGIRMLRRSLHLRAACGARPHVTAAQAALAQVLGDGPEADDLRDIVGVTAAELGLTWLLP